MPGVTEESQSLLIRVVRGRLYIFTKKVSFDFAITLCSIGAPDIPKNFAQRSEMENMVF